MGATRGAVLGETYLLQAVAYGPERADGSRESSAPSLPVEVAVASPDPNDPLPLLPSVPDVVVVSGDRSLTVSVVVDDDTVSFGAAGEFTVVARGVSPGVVAGMCTVVVPATSCVISGLVNGVAYEVSARAQNAAGFTGFTDPAVTATPRNLEPPPIPPLPSKPSAPGSVSLLAARGAITVSWTAATAPDDAPVIMYRAVASPDGASCRVSPPQDSCVISGLRDTTSYTVSVVAINAGGMGPAAVAGPVTPALAPPAPPAAVMVMPGDSQATVVVTPGDGGGPVDRFVVTASPGGASCVITPPARACVVDGLVNDTTYTSSVTAHNGAGSVPGVAPSGPVTPAEPIDPVPVDIEDPPGPGGVVAMEDGQPISDMTVAPDRGATGLVMSTGTFTLVVEGVDRRGNPVGLQNDQVLLLVDDGRARTHGTGFRPGSMVRLFLAPQTQPEQPEQPELAAAGVVGRSIGPMMDLGHISVDDLGAFTGTVALPGDLAPGDYVLQVTGVTVANSERAVTLGVRVLDTDVTITVFKGERTRVSGRLDRVVATGISDGVPAGTRLVPYIRVGRNGQFRQGRATIIVQDDGTFRWTRKVRANRPLTAYVTFADTDSNTVTWARIR